MKREWERKRSENIYGIKLALRIREREDFVIYTVFNFFYNFSLSLLDVVNVNTYNLIGFGK